MNRREAKLSMRTGALIGVLMAGCGGPSNPDAGLTPDAFNSSDSSLLMSIDSGRGDSGPETCGTEGMTRTAACGNCGLESQSCTAGFWVGDGACLAQGMCAAGATESRFSGMCQQERRICDSTCAWRDWTPVGSPGACMPGAVRSVEGGTCGAGTWMETCNDMCAWASTCEDPCRGMRRTTPWHSEEICIPGGDFRRGGGPAGPYQTVFVSTFLIDRYPVTNARVAACEGTPMCPFPVGSADMSRPDFPSAGVNKTRACPQTRVSPSFKDRRQFGNVIYGFGATPRTHRHRMVTYRASAAA